ncbi:hypothetical protein [Sansalvadorimonas verongulae]|uniref:hypothetical protein n=1 Tax=Sansalvadorimonas verongulae TaxID=2172824 RepID=UPI0012BC6C4F|nr:hypothetical protein [Sansalvadorimonas verongulae]MTI13185.1 hypothetical protein [Sansalvadorimonas verongulae]
MTTKSEMTTQAQTLTQSELVTIICNVLDDLGIELPEDGCEEFPEYEDYGITEGAEIDVSTLCEAVAIALGRVLTSDERAVVMQHVH